MSYNWNTRTELLLGADRMERLAHSHVLVVGLGGVGAYAAEQICRAGIGHMTIVDADTVNESNINRQLPALHSTLGMAKAVSKRLRGLGIHRGIPVVFSTEIANPDAIIEVEGEQCKRTTTGTVSYMPAIFGCHLASYVINQLKVES